MDPEVLDTVVFSSYEDNYYDMFLNGYWSALSILWTRWEHLNHGLIYRTALGEITHCAHNIDVQPSALLFPKRDLFFGTENIEELKEPIIRLPNERTIHGRRYTNYAWFQHLQQQGVHTLSPLFDYDAMSAWLAQQSSGSIQKQNTTRIHPRMLLYLLFIILRYIPM